MICLIYFSALLIFCTSDSPSYVKSIFGAPGTDEVANEYVDGIEILPDKINRSATTSIYNNGFSSKPIEPSDYPYPGKQLNGTCTWDLLQEESNNIIKKYSFSNITQDQLYRHPAAAQQWYTTFEELDKADRSKIRFTLQPNYGRHVLPAFVPPGEVVTIEIPESLVGSLSISLNQQTRDFSGGDQPQFKERLNRLLIQQIYLQQKVNTIGLPYGATVMFYYSGNDPVEVTVSGVILQPYFYYGMTSDEEWETDLSKRPGPICYLDTGNMVFMVPSSYVRSAKRMNDAMHYWRSAIQISQTTARDVFGYNNLQHERILNPVLMKYDSFVPAGAAVAFVGGNFCHFPPSWIYTVVSYESSVDNPWGTVHEINHHHQSNWAMTQESGEMSNNVINLVIYAKTNECSAKRNQGGGLTDWPSYSIAGQHLNDNTEYGLARYSTLLHLFGVDKFKEFVRADQNDLWYPRKDFGSPGAEMLRASHVFNRDMHYHWNFHNSDDSALNSGANNTFDSLRALHLKPFHPITNYYAVGHVVDGVGFITARPFRINPFQQTIDFVETMVKRENKEWFGDFEFHSCSFEAGRESSWVEQSKGVYTMTPKDSLTEVETVNVSYLDKTTNEISVVICQFIQQNNCAEFTRIGFIPKSENSLQKAYKYAVTSTNESNIIFSTYRTDGIFASDYTNGSVNVWISIMEGMITPPESGKYVFYTSADPQAAFYLSEKPLKGDPDEDEDKMICHQGSTNMDFNTCNYSKEITLQAGTYYYFRHVVYATSKGRSWVGYRFNGDTTTTSVPGSWLRYKYADEETIWNNQFRPNFERIYLMDQWNGQNFIKNDQSKWEFYNYPPGSVVINSNNFQGQENKNLTIKDVLTDSDGTTEYRVNWWPSNIARPFPHVFDIDMGKSESFKALRIGKAGNPSLFGSHSFVQIFLAPYNYTCPQPVDENDTTTVVIPYDPQNYSIDHEESLIFEGIVDHTKSDIFEFNKTLSGRYLRFNFVYNNFTWKDGNPGRTCISDIEIGTALHNKKIYPMTNTRYITKTGTWTERRGGCYYNGKGYTGTTGSQMEIKIPKYKPEFGIIGDYYKGMGTADVLIDDQNVGTIGEKSLDPQNDARKLTKASRSYKSLLFYTTDLDPSKAHTLKIQVKSGEVTLAAILTHQMIVKWNTDDDRYPTILRTEFDDDPPEITDWDTPTIEEDNFVPPPPEEEVENSSDDKKKGMSPGATAAVVIVVILVVAAAAVGVFIMYKKQIACFNKNDNGASRDEVVSANDI